MASTVMPMRVLDVDTGRGQILYRRYDDHYGLLAPAGEHRRHARRP